MVLYRAFVFGEHDGKRANKQGKNQGSEEGGTKEWMDGTKKGSIRTNNTLVVIAPDYLC